MARQRMTTAYVCDNCGYDSPKWYGKCPSCGNWDTLKEIKIEPEAAAAGAAGRAAPVDKPEALDTLSTEDELRFHTGYGELDRVLGGGAVKGSLVLIGGEPGIGKSTLMLQICRSLSQAGRVLYASGEESKRQIKLRAERLGVNDGNILIMAETKLEAVLAACDAEKPAVCVVDSIQTIYKTGLSTAPGNVTQIKECAMALLRMAKDTGTIVFVVGHVNKDGEIAGPKILEHMVDCVLYFEGEQQNAYRILRAAKNRFGSTNEIGVFEMNAGGLAEVENPSAALLSGRPAGVPGTCITAVMEGTRPILAEVQALVSPSVFGNPRRMASGIDYNRAALLLAVLEKRAGMLISNQDAYINVVGGLRIDEPAADLATVIALASSFTDKPVIGDTVVFGEVGLAGELRRVTMLEQRIAEAARMKITRCVCPFAGETRCHVPDGIEVVRIRSVREAITACLS
ncbi:MAG: DNA repair protein RadA [Clostridiales bacterium]|nr:MAG: DNA repair protein RadA [Clostridiales bacterium]